MSRIKVDRITDKAGTGAPILVNGMNVTGKSTMGDIVGAAVTFNSITGGSANFSSDVSIGGTLTYEDVTNIDSVGLITARDGINITGGDLNAASNLILKVDGGEKVRITSVGNLLVGTDTARTEVGGMGNPQVQVEGTSASSANLSIARNSDNSAGGYLTFAKSRGTSDGSNVIVQNGDTLGNIIFASSDGADVNQYSARIRGKLEGTPGANDVPGCLTFETTADGQTASTERLRIGPAGQFGIGGSNYGTSGQVLTSGGASAAPQWADAGGGAWEVVSTHVLAGSDTYLDFNNWSNAYQKYQLVFNDVYYNHTDFNIYMRIYKDATSGNTGTLMTASSYTANAVNTSNSANGVGGAWSGWVDYHRLGGNNYGPLWNGTYDFYMGQPVSTPSGNNECSWIGQSFRERDTSVADSCTYANASDREKYLTGVRVFFFDQGSAISPTGGRFTLYRMKYS